VRPDLTGLGRASARLSPRTKRLAGAGALIVVVAVAVAVGAAFLALRGSGTTPGSVECNGAPTLCGFRLDEVSLATTHNSMNDAEDAFAYPNQQRGIEAQLGDGVRGFLVDAYLGSVRMAGNQQIVYTDLSDRRLRKLLKSTGSEPARHARRLREQAGPPAADAPREVYLCHQFCELGAVRFSEVVGVLQHFLDEHRGEVVVVVIQDELAAEELVPVIEDGGLDPYLATIDPSLPLPTLGSMVESGRRLVIGLEKGDLGPAIPNVYADGLIQEVPYDYSSVAELEDEDSCGPQRGHDDAPLFLLNHWVSPPSSEVAAEANAEDVLLSRAERCSAERGEPVNLVAVDFYESGDLFASVDELNGRLSAGD
jgi:hypothetical protein